MTINDKEIKVVDETKKEACTLDLLLAKDIKEFKVKTKMVEIERLTEVMGKPFIVGLKPLSIQHEEEFQQRFFKVEYDQDMNPEFINKSFELKLNVLVEAVYLDDVQLFKKLDVMKMFNAKTPTQLIEKMLTRGEITKLYDQYSELCGFNKTSVKEIKNL